MQRFEKYDKASRIYKLSHEVLSSKDRTLASYLNEVNKFLNGMIDEGITALTSKNELDFSNFDEVPNALFLRVSDSFINANRLITLLIKQMCGTLIDKAKRNQECEKTEREELLRNVYFVMDEFGNLPRFRHFDSIIAIARSRKIFLMPIVQSYKQLDAVYGKEVTTYIRAWCILIEANNDKKRRG